MHESLSFRFDDKRPILFTRVKCNDVDRPEPSGVAFVWPAFFSLRDGRPPYRCDNKKERVSTIRWKAEARFVARL